jgi:SPP1 gp7 family putative phage head morphogenesis protein
MHNRIVHLYAHVKLSATDKKQYKKVQDTFNDAAKYIHTKGSFDASDLDHKQVRPLIDATNEVLGGAITSSIETEVPAAMLQKLQTDVFVFSGMKTYTQLKEASLLLIDKDKNIKNYQQYQQDILKINDTYNENYLRAEHQHAVAAAQSAAQYHKFMEDADRYDLQIRTAGDDRVRSTHAVLNGITLPATSPYWNTTFTPFDWGCRCIIIQVLKNKYEVTDLDVAEKASDSAVGEIFRYNPGKQEVIFPPKHPYYKLSKQAMSVVEDMADKNSSNTNNDSIDLTQFKSINSDVVKKVIEDFANKFPENFATGLKEVNIKKTDGFMMQHSAFVDMATMKRKGGSILTISSHNFEMPEHFNPLNELMAGMEAIKDGRQLTFNQEYAFEALWHEILHAKTNTKFYRLTSSQVRSMETVNQFVARHTYPQLIEAFGGNASNQDKILEDGYGYKSWVKNFRSDLKKKNIDEKKAVEFLQPHLMKDYSTLGSKIKELLNNSDIIESK